MPNPDDRELSEAEINLTLGDAFQRMLRALPKDVHCVKCGSVLVPHGPALKCPTCGVL